MIFRSGLIVYLCFFSLLSKSQEKDTTLNNSISFEFGRNGLVYHLEYEHQFLEKKIGIRFITGSNFGKYLTFNTARTGIYKLFGNSKNHFLEFGTDVNFITIHEISDDQNSIGNIVKPSDQMKTFYFSANVGYRIQGSKILFRIGISPCFVKKEFISGSYFSVGYRF